jgi:hypothetical protein
MKTVVVAGAEEIVLAVEKPKPFVCLIRDAC